MLRSHDCCFLGIIYLIPFIESKQIKTNIFQKFNQGHCILKSNGTIKCSESQCNSQQPSAITGMWK